MGRVFVAAQDAKTVPVVRSAAFDSAETFKKGAVLGIASDGEVVQLTSGAGVTGVVGVALEDVYSKPGWEVANDDKVAWRTGAVREVSMVDLVKNPHQIFSGRLTDGAGADVTPTQAMVGESRGLLKLANGEWTVNNADTTNDAVQIVDIITGQGGNAGNYILFRFLESVLAVAANVA